MKASQITTSVQQNKSIKRGNFSLDRTSTKKTNKMLTQQSYPISHQPFLTTNSISNEIANLNTKTLSEVSKSQVFICSFPNAKEQLGSGSQPNASNKYIFGNNNKEIFKNIRDSPTDILAKRSVQILIGLNQGMVRAQYSKISRKKDQLIKKNTITNAEMLDHPIHKVDHAEEEKLIEKYRQLLQSKQKPFNMVNKLYQIQLLTTKQATIQPQIGFKATSVKLNITRKGSNIEDKIQQFSEKSKASDKVKDMLLCGSEKFISKQSQQKNTTLTNFVSNRKPYSQQRYKQVRPLRQIRNKNMKIREQSMIPKMDSPIKGSEPRLNENVKKTQLLGSNFQSPTKMEKSSAVPLPKKISATAFLIYEVIEQRNKYASKKSQLQPVKKKELASKIHASFNIKTASQIASLTKIMTCIVAIQICQKLAINPHQEKYKTGLFESVIRGTTADIQPGEIYTIHQLLHGLMLPSGNDASLALARWGGNVLLLAESEGQKRKALEKCQKTLINQKWLSKNKYLRYKEDKIKYKRCYNRFIAEMNKKARVLGLERTTYVNSHGLSNPQNKSCCLDLALLCEYVMQNNYFRSIVACKQYEGVIDKYFQASETLSPKKKKGRTSKLRMSQDPQEMNLLQDAEDDIQMNRSDEQDEQEIQVDLRASSSKKEKRVQQVEERKEVLIIQKQIRWVNTHRLVNKKEAYLGIKTGVTTTAGACLASYINIKDRSFVIIVLNSKKLSLRFIDTQLLRKWLVKKESLSESESRLDYYSQTNPVQ